MRNLKNVLVKSSEEPMIELPQVADLSAFAESNALMTLARYSEYLALPKEKQASLHVAPIFSDEKPTTVGYVIAAAVPGESANPIRGKELIRHLVSQTEKIAAAHSFLSASFPAPTEPKFPLFSKDTFFLPRVNSVVLGQKPILDFMNEKLGIKELNELWRAGFFIPSAGI
jgi:hypothetical protein